MKFFAKQKVDQIGITAVTLQKVLLFLMILSLFTVFNGGFFSFLLCLIGFIGAYKRSPGLLAAYVSISAVLIVLCAIVAISSFFIYPTVYNDFSSSSSSSSEVIPLYNRELSYRLKAALASAIGSESSVAVESSDSIVSSPSNELSQSASASASVASNEFSGSAGSYSYFSYSTEDDATGIMLLLIIVMVMAFFLAYLKIYSLVLSWRLRKMILLNANALPVTEAPAQQTHEFTPTNTSCAEAENEIPAHPPVFAPGFAPYPYMPMMMPQGQFPPQFPGQLPHHVMFGQQPVFYTYAPMNQQPASEEKL